MNIKHFLLVFLVLMTVPGTRGNCQEPLSLEQCIVYAFENNRALQKDRLALETAAQSRREVIGALLPQLNASAGITRNIQKTTFAMPNFVNAMLPVPDPDAAKYMVVTMGMDYSANWGASLTQQVINFSLFNAISITDAAAQMAELGVEASENDIIAQTATLFYGIQVLEYAISQFDQSIALMDRTLKIMGVNKDNGIVRQVDYDRITVTRTNLETQKNSMLQALDVQKNLLKLQMGYPMDDPIEVTPVDVDDMEYQLRNAVFRPFEIESLVPYKMVSQQKTMTALQYKSAVYENLPVIALTANYSMNYMGDHFRGETYNHFPVSMVGLNLRMPIFSGMSKTAKVKKAKIEMLKTEKDEQTLRQTLSMGHSNAQLQLEQQLRNIDAQHRNKELAQEVFVMTESNFNEGISSLSDVLNASSSLIEAQMSFVTALNGGMNAFIDLKRADGTINEINKSMK